MFLCGKASASASVSDEKWGLGPEEPEVGLDPRELGRMVCFLPCFTEWEFTWHQGFQPSSPGQPCFPLLPLLL